MRYNIICGKKHKIIALLWKTKSRNRLCFSSRSIGSRLYFNRWRCVFNLLLRFVFKFIIININFTTVFLFRFYFFCNKQLHRQALDFAPFLKIHTHQAKYSVKWPFSETTCIKGTLDARQDRTVYYAYDVPTLRKPNVFEYWGGGKLEFIFDNTRKRGLNLYYGTRFKLFAEYFKQLNKNETDISILGFDIRKYTKIHRDFIWANRISASTSFGKRKLIYYMGGVDNWFSPRFNYDTPIDLTQNYAYQTLATPMRGFTQNIRNGNSFALYNSELRLPIFRYLMNKPLKSDFLNNFQVVGFGDIVL